MVDPLILRAYQTDGVEAVRDELRAGRKRVMLNSPTGSGKTEIGVAIIRGAIAKGKRVTFLANRIHLVGQTSERLLRSGIEHGILQARNSTPETFPITVGSIQTVARRGMPESDLIVIDEAHAVAGSAELRRIIFVNKDTPVLGLSATPWSKGLAKYYAELGGALFESMVTAITIPELIKLGHLVDADIYAPDEPDLSNISIVAGDYHEKQLGEAVDKPALIGDIVSHWKRLAGGKATVCFATNIAHSKHIVEQFTGAGITAEHLDCYTSDLKRKATLARVLAGTTTIVSNVGILAEGWDFPACEVMILARPTRSLIRYIQMAGRVLRPFPGKTKALILDHSGTCRRLGFPTDALNRPMDDGKPRKESEPQGKPEPLPTVCVSCSFLKPAGMHKCAACGFAPERQSEVKIGDGQLTLLKRGMVLPLSDRFGDKQTVYSMLRHEVRTKQRKPGYAAHKYRKIFGVWPRGLQEYDIEPTPEFRSWLKAETIRFAHAKGRDDS